MLVPREAEQVGRAAGAGRVGPCNPRQGPATPRPARPPERSEVAPCKTAVDASRAAGAHRGRPDRVGALARRARRAQPWGLVGLGQEGDDGAHPADVRPGPGRGHLPGMDRRAARHCRCRDVQAQVHAAKAGERGRSATWRWPSRSPSKAACNRLGSRRSGGPRPGRATRGHARSRRYHPPATGGRPGERREQRPAQDGPHLGTRSVGPIIVHR